MCLIYMSSVMVLLYHIRAINYNCPDAEGKLTQPLNGIEMSCSREANTVEDIIKRINDKIDFAVIINGTLINVNRVVNDSRHKEVFRQTL